MKGKRESGCLLHRWDAACGILSGINGNEICNHISEMINAFSPAPLQREQMKEFYCEDTMEYRTSDKYDSPIKDLDKLNPEDAWKVILSQKHFP